MKRSKFQMKQRPFQTMLSWLIPAALTAAVTLTFSSASNALTVPPSCTNNHGHRDVFSIVIRPHKTRHHPHHPRHPNRGCTRGVTPGYSHTQHTPTHRMNR